MPPRTLLSAEQRTRLFSIPIDTAEVTRHYVLDADDLALIGARRRASNRLGFAVQFCALRYPGRVLDPSESPPVPMLAFVRNRSASIRRYSANTPAGPKPVASICSNFKGYCVSRASA